MSYSVLVAFRTGESATTWQERYVGQQDMMFSKKVEIKELQRVAVGIPMGVAFTVDLLSLEQW